MTEFVSETNKYQMLNIRLCEMLIDIRIVFQRAELAELRAKHDQEEEMKRAQAKRDKLFVALFILLCESFVR